MVKHVFRLFLAVAIVSQTMAQLCGGVDILPSGGIGGTGSYKNGPAWGSVSGSYDGRRLGPVDVSGGAHFKLPNDGFAGAQASVQPGVGGTSSLYGKVNIFDTPTHRLDVQGHHDRILNRDLKPVGPAVNEVGANYKHVGGATAHIVASKVGSGPIQGSLGASVPLVSTPQGGINLGVKAIAGEGMKPQGEIGVVGEFKF
ncbi:hypothetical protein PPYR_09917 [Photinus pyralis]|uniref:Attacin C-terminal domain-containing protein n=1 Tax=Photinus pyralis TaxID=7054 RepID=A0A5N4AEY0_PHOPY|nr:hypothetical protein PPYR_09917 [Photinus pyralis]